MDWRHMAAVRQTIEAAREHGSGPQIASSRSCGPQIASSRSCAPQIEILHVAGADHNVQIDNPLGFVDSVMATCDPRGIHADVFLASGRGADGKMFGRQYILEHGRPAMI